MADFTPIETQEAFDAAIKDRLARERAKFADYDDIKKQLETLKTEKGELAKSIEANGKELETLKADLTKRDEEIKGYKAEALKTKIAIETGLPLELRDRLRGDDEEAMKADAETLKKFTSARTAPKADPEPASTKKGKAEAELRQVYKNIIGGNE